MCLYEQAWHVSFHYIWQKESLCQWRQFTGIECPKIPHLPLTCHCRACSALADYSVHYTCQLCTDVSDFLGSLSKHKMKTSRQSFLNAILLVVQVTRHQNCSLDTTGCTDHIPTDSAGSLDTKGPTDTSLRSQSKIWL